MSLVCDISVAVTFVLRLSVVMAVGQSDAAAVCRELSFDDIPSDSVSDLSDDVFCSDLDSDPDPDHYFIELQGNEMHLTGPDVNQRIKYEQTSHQNVMTSLQPSCLKLRRQGDVHLGDEDVARTTRKTKTPRSVRIDSSDIARVRAELFAHRTARDDDSPDMSDKSENGIHSAKHDAALFIEPASDRPRSAEVNVNAARSDADLFTAAPRKCVNTNNKIDTADRRGRRSSNLGTDVTCNGSPPPRLHDDCLEAEGLNCALLPRTVRSSESIKSEMKGGSTESQTDATVSRPTTHERTGQQEGSSSLLPVRMLLIKNHLVKLEILSTSNYYFTLKFYVIDADVVDAVCCILQPSVVVVITEWFKRDEHAPR